MLIERKLLSGREGQVWIIPNGQLRSKRFDLYFFFYDIRLVLIQDFCLKRKIMWAISVIYELSELKRYLKRGGPVT